MKNWKQWLVVLMSALLLSGFATGCNNQETDTEPEEIQTDDGTVTEEDGTEEDGTEEETDNEDEETDESTNNEKDTEEEPASEEEQQ